MIGPGTGVRVYLACGVTDMRKGIAGLAALTQDVLRQKPTSGAVFAFRGRRAPLEKRSPAAQTRAKRNAKASVWAGNYPLASPPR